VIVAPQFVQKRGALDEAFNDCVGAFEAPNDVVIPVGEAIIGEANAGAEGAGKAGVVE